MWRYGLPWHKMLNAAVAEQSIHKLKNQRRRIDSNSEFRAEALVRQIFIQ